MYTTLTTEDIRKQFTTLYYNNQLSDDGNLEIVGSSFIANEESIFGKVDYSYIAREIKWYRSQSLSIDTLFASTTLSWLSILIDGLFSEPSASNDFVQISFPSLLHLCRNMLCLLSCKFIRESV